MGTQGYVPHLWDYDSRSYRIPGEEDVALWARLADALPEVRIVQPICQDARLSTQESCLKMARAVVLNTSKHYLAQPLDLYEAQVWLDLARIIAHGNEAHSKRVISLMATVNSPLQLDTKNAGLLRFSAENEIPIAFFGGSLSGATSPVTLAGTLSLHNAETLFGLTLHQFIRPGAPFIYGTATSNIDLRTGNALYASIEYSLLKCAAGQLARHNHLPLFSALALADAPYPEVQAGIEKGLTVLLTFLSGTNYTSGSGNLGTCQAAAFEQLVIDHEVYQMVRRFVSGIQVDDEHLAWDTLVRVGIGGNYLVDPQTVAWLRSGEHYIPTLANRKGIHSKTMLDKAHDFCQHVFDEYQPQIDMNIVDPINQYTERKMEQI